MQRVLIQYVQGFRILKHNCHPLFWLDHNVGSRKYRLTTLIISHRRETKEDSPLLFGAYALRPVIMRFVFAPSFVPINLEIGKFAQVKASQIGNAPSHGFHLLAFQHRALHEECALTRPSFSHSHSLPSGSHIALAEDRSGHIPQMFRLIRCNSIVD